MNPFLRRFLFGAALVALFGATYIGVSLVSGATIADLPRFSARSAQPTSSSGARARSADPSAPEPSTRPSSDRPLAASALGSFLLPAPFGAHELAELERRLREHDDELTARLAALARRESALDDRERALESRARELRGLLTALERDGGSRATDSKSATVANDDAGWNEVARFFADGDADLAAKRLAAYEAADAARILRALDEERASEIVQALSPERAKPLLEAFRTLRGSSEPSAAPKSSPP